MHREGVAIARAKLRKADCRSSDAFQEQDSGLDGGRGIIGIEARKEKSVVFETSRPSFFHIYYGGF